MSGERAADAKPAPITIALTWLLGVAVAALAFAAAVGEVLTRANPGVVSQIGIGNRARAEMNLMLVQVGTGKLKLTDAQVERVAVDALAAWPMDTQALVLLATRAIQAGDMTGALRYARLVNRLSRRELGAQVVLLSDALDRNDLPAAVNLLDVSMRSAGERQRAVMYPVLAKGLEQPAFRRTVAPVVDQRRDWAPSFFTFAVEEAGAVDEVAELYMNVEPATRSFLAPTLLARLVTKLSDAGKVDDARRMYLATPRKRAADLMDAGMTTGTFDPEIGALGWTLEDSPTISSRQIQGGAKGQYGVLVDVGPGDASLAMSRILFLQPGTYSFSARERNEEASGTVASHWIMRCDGTADGDEIWRSDSGASVTIPSRCGSQLLQLIVNQSDSAQYGQLVIDDVKLTRAARSPAPEREKNRGDRGN